MNLPLKFSSGGKQGKFKGSGNMLPLVQLSRVQGRCYTRSALSPGKKRKEYAQMPLDFDHLVLMVRDQLTEHAQQLLQDGFHLTDLAVHNLGSINRLITLESAYIELLGWPAGKPRSEESRVGKECVSTC